MSSLWLNSHRKDVYSQNGEDGIIEAIFNAIGTKNKQCCEFGAHNGLLFSNTANLEGWQCVLIESDDGRFTELQANRPSAMLIHATVALHSDNKLDRILNRTSLARNFDLLSIDVDGEDAKIWATVEQYSPRVVVIEVDSCVAPGSDKLPTGATIDEAVKIGRAKGYDLAIHTGNAIFVQSQYADKLLIDRDNWQELFDRKWAPNYAG